MGTFSYTLEVISADGARSEVVNALVNTGSTFTCLPASLMHELGIVPYRRIQSELPDGSIIDDDIGEAYVRLAGIERPTIVTFAGEDAPPVIGNYTLEGALLVVDPVRKRLAPTYALRYRTQVRRKLRNGPQNKQRNHPHPTEICRLPQTGELSKMPRAWLPKHRLCTRSPHTTFSPKAPCP